jgi:signal peptidase I
MKNHRILNIFFAALLITGILVAIFFLRSGHENPSITIESDDLPQLNETPNSLDPESPCFAQFDVELCVTNMWQQDNETFISIQGKSSDPSVVPGDLFSLIENLILDGSNENNLEPLLLSKNGESTLLPQSEIRYTRMIDGSAFQTISFPSTLSKVEQNTLQIPGYLETVIFKEPINIHIDLHEKLQPGLEFAINESIEILGEIIHFNKVSMTENGDDGLRLSVSSDTSGTTDAFFVKGFTFGESNKDVSLIGNKGVWSPHSDIEIFSDIADDQDEFTFHIEQVVIYIPGPFYFNLDSPMISSSQILLDELTSLSQSEYVPTEESYTFDLDSYKYNDIPINTGDIVYCLIQGDNTELFHANKESQFVPELVAVLPGHVYQIFVHPDHKGIDYLTGIKKLDGDTVYFQSGQLFRLFFSDPAPYLLVSFPEEKTQWVGNNPIGKWSSDGRIFSFEHTDVTLNDNTMNRKIGWVDLNCQENTNCEVNYISNPEEIELHNLQISPTGDFLVMEGVNHNTGSGQSDIYYVNLSDRNFGDLLNLSNTDWANESMVVWYPNSSKIAYKSPVDSTQTEYNLSIIDLSTFETSKYDWPPYHVLSYQFYNSAEKIILSTLNHSMGGKGTEEIVIWDWKGDGLVSQPYASGGDFVQYALSPNDGILAYIDAGTNQLHLVDISNHAEYTALSECFDKFISYFLWVE